MCGICGIFRPDGGDADPARVLRMRDSMLRRGPDGCGLVSGPGFALGHRRLSILDLSADGQQPMANEDGSLSVVCNGEIYNFADLRLELERAGHRFRSRTDTEILVHGFEEWGIHDLLRRIRGMYAFALLDIPSRQIHLARDPLGKKPLFFRWADGELAFASSCRALVLGLRTVLEVDLNAVDDFLWNGYIPGPETIVSGVQKLPAGASWHVGPQGQPKELRHWQPDFSHPESGISEAAWHDRIEAVLTTAVRRRMVADVPVGVLLSGGVDSGLVTALAAKSVGRVATFSVAHEDPREDETAYAQAIAERYHTRHNILPVHSDARHNLPRLVAAMGEPLADTSLASLYAIAHMARESVTVVLTGDGGDEAFGGYTEYWAAFLADRIRGLVPGVLRGPLGCCAHGLRRAPGVLRRAGTLLHLATQPLESTVACLWPAEAKTREELYTPEMLHRVGRRSPRQHIFDALVRDESMPYVDRLMQASLQTTLVDMYLTKVDYTTMGASLEARCPFLDLDVIETAMRIPARMRFQGGEPKGLLRRLARRYLPAQCVDRRKQGFTAPLNAWFRADWTDLVNDVILGPQVERRGWFRRDALERIVDEHRRGINHVGLLWALTVLEVWLRVAIDQTLGPDDSI